MQGQKGRLMLLNAKSNHGFFAIMSSFSLDFFDQVNFVQKLNENLF